MTSLFCRVLPDAPRVDADSALCERSASKERSPERRKLKRRGPDHDSDSDSADDSSRRPKRDQPKRKVLKPSGNNIPQSHRSKGKAVYYKKPRASYWSHDDRVDERYKSNDKSGSARQHMQKSVQRKSGQNTSSCEKKSSDREVMMPSKVHEKKESEQKTEGNLDSEINAADDKKLERRGS